MNVQFCSRLAKDIQLVCLCLLSDIWWELSWNWFISFKLSKTLRDGIWLLAKHLIGNQGARCCKAFFYSLVSIKVSEFCHNLSFWVVSQFELIFFHNSSLWVLSQIRLMIFIAIWFFCLVTIYVFSFVTINFFLVLSHFNFSV